MRRLLLSVAVGLGLGLGLAAVAGGCSSSEEGPKSAAEALEKATGVAWIVSTDAENGTLLFAAPKNGPLAMPAGTTSPERAALAFLEAHKAIFKMAAPETELVPAFTQRASDGSTHVRFRQEAHGLQVRGGTWTAHFDNGLRLTSMSGTYVFGVHALSTEPAVLSEAAVETAKRDALRQAPTLTAAQIAAGHTALEFVPVRGAAPALAWAIEVSGRSEAERIALREHVDAKTGQVLQTASLLRGTTTTGRPPQAYAPYNVEAPDLSFTIADAQPSVLKAEVTGAEVTVWSSSKPDDLIPATTVSPWTDAINPPGATIAAMANVQTVFAYLADHTWGPDDKPFRSWDGLGAPLDVYVNDNSQGNIGAYFDGIALNFGDGDGATQWATSGSLDIVSHELGHAWTQATSHLEYVRGSDAAAIDESMGDVFAALVTHRVRNDDATDFVYGEDSNTGRIPDRNMIRVKYRTDVDVSKLTPERRQDFQKYEDSNKSSHAFYLLTHGDTDSASGVKVPCGIGWAAADRLYWRLQTSHIKPNETFADLAVHSLAAARELGIPEMPVACAWVAVGALSEEKARTDWNITCEKEGVEAGAPDGGDNALVTAPAKLVECAVSLGGGGGSLTP